MKGGNFSKNAISCLAYCCIVMHKKNHIIVTTFLRSFHAFVWSQRMIVSSPLKFFNLYSFTNHDTTSVMIHSLLYLYILYQLQIHYKNQIFIRILFENSFLAFNLWWILSFFLHYLMIQWANSVFMWSL